MFMSPEAECAAAVWLAVTFGLHTVAMTRRDSLHWELIRVEHA